MSDSHDRAFIFLLITGAIALCLLLVYETYLQLRNYKRKRERREQRRAERKAAKRRR